MQHVLLPSKGAWFGWVKTVAMGFSIEKTLDPALTAAEAGIIDIFWLYCIVLIVLHLLTALIGQSVSLLFRPLSL